MNPNIKDNEQISLYSFIDILINNFKIISFVTLIFTLISLLYIFLIQTPVYKATVKIQMGSYQNFFFDESPFQILSFDDTNAQNISVIENDLKFNYSNEIQLKRYSNNQFELMAIDSSPYEASKKIESVMNNVINESKSKINSELNWKKFLLDNMSESIDYLDNKINKQYNDDPINLSGTNSIISEKNHLQFSKNLLEFNLEKYKPIYTRNINEIEVEEIKTNKFILVIAISLVGLVSSIIFILFKEFYYRYVNRNN